MRDGSYQPILWWQYPMPGSVTRECISSTWMQEIVCLRQLEPACFKVLFQCKRLKAEYSKIKCQFLVFQEFLQVNRLPLFGRVWSFAMERFSLDASVQTIWSYVMACAFSNIYVCFFLKGGPSTEEGDVILLLSFFVCPSSRVCCHWAERSKGMPLLWQGENNDKNSSYIRKRLTLCSKPPTSPF